MGRGQHITRAELYRLLWTEPTTRVARTYGISDVGLAKVCEKYEIPRPPRGYWARLKHGQHPPQMPLPKPDHDPTIEFAEREARPEPTVEYVQAATVPAEPIRISDHLRGCHELVTRANDELSSAKIDDDGIIVAAERRALDIRTSKSGLRRALLIMDAILGECVRRGYGTAAGPTVTIDRHAIKFGIWEVVETIREPDQEADFSKRYEFLHSRVKSKRVATGRFVLAITEGRGHGMVGGQHTWRGTDKHRLEDRLDKVIVALVEISVAAAQHAEEQKRRAEWERQEAARRADAAKQRAERLIRYRAEKAKLIELLRQADDFDHSQRLRNLIAAVRAKHEAKGAIDPEGEIGRWIAWATLHADRLDPLKPKTPSVLDEHFEEEDSRPALQSWGRAEPQAPQSYWEQRDWWNRSR